MNSTKSIFYPILFVLLGLQLTTGCQDSADLSGDPDFRSTLDSVSYSLGYYYGTSMASEGIDEFSYNNFVYGMRAGVEQEDPDMDRTQMQMAMQNFQMELQQRVARERENQSSTNLEEGRQFLEENAQREDIEVTDSGLQYRVIEEGNGAQPEPESTVQVHYRGTLLNGEEFDSSYERGEPAEFPLNRVIPGWTEGLQLMQEGAKYELFLPSDLGYGDNPPPGSPIEAGMVLKFEVELLSVLD